MGISTTVASIKNPNGELALHLAAAEGNTDICKYLINDLKLKLESITGETPLHSATSRRHLGTVVYLLKRGANPNIADDSGFIPLHYAVEIGTTLCCVYI
ncbi:hypothetical protein IFM89_031521 [Coptis chinensis]|uniref:Ankyrin repeat protein n=1 Tax=Coptis chinensis TaxID=261450 RepID=A0A835M508_9MAGN|nr:hypothetical protein IFM89_031521 [Coptis chinensis]